MLTEVVLRATYFQETDVEALTNALGAKALQILQLESVPFSSRSFRIRILCFSACSLGDAEMPLLTESLGALPLEELVHLAEALSSHSTIKCLDLSCNRIGNVGASALAEALLVNNACMEKLDLRGNWVGACQLRYRPHQELQIEYHNKQILWIWFCLGSLTGSSIAFFLMPDHACMVHECDGSADHLRISRVSISHFNITYSTHCTLRVSVNVYLV